MSQGISLGIETLDELRAGWTKTLAACSDESKIVLEDQIVGFDLRALVVGDRFVAGASRVQPFVVGDGHNAVIDLIREEKTRRANHVQLSQAAISIDDETLDCQGESRTSIPARGKVVVLNPLPLVSKGAVPIEVTPMVCPELREMAVRSVQAIPGLEIAAVDMIVSSLDSPDGAAVLELNSRPAMSMHTCPALGTPVDVASPICDYYGWGKQRSV